MAVAAVLPSSTDVHLAEPSVSILQPRIISNVHDEETTSIQPTMDTTKSTGVSGSDLLEEAVRLAALYKAAITTVLASLLNLEQVDRADKAAVLALPLDKPAHRVVEAAASLPRRKSSLEGPLAAVTASLLFPSEAGSLSALIKYEQDRKRIREYFGLQRRFDVLYNTVKNEETSVTWDARLRRQGVWKPSAEEMEVLRQGAPALPMPVRVPGRYEFEPFLEWVAKGGTHELVAERAFPRVEGCGEEGDIPELDSGSETSAVAYDANHNGRSLQSHTSEEAPVLLNNGDGEDFYHTPGLEFRRGVLYEDARLDLCKQVVGPDHIGALMQSLRTNTFVRHFLLGNNIIGPTGARAIAEFITEFPDRMDTWYLAGNCIDRAGFEILVDAMVKSTSVTNIWLKRNPLGSGAAGDLARLITGCRNLRTLDLDQTELGDEGAAELFNMLIAAHPVEEGGEGEALPLRNLYLNGTGISTRGAAALGEFLASAAGAGVESVYMSCNPLADAGALALAEHIVESKSLKRLVLQSTGLSAEGVIALCTALRGSESLTVLDLGQAYATRDLGAGYNCITDEAVDAVVEFVRSCKALEGLNITRNVLSFNGLACVMQAVAESESMLICQRASVLGKEQLAGGVTHPPPSLAYPINPATMFGTHQAVISEVDLHALELAVRDRLERNVRARFGGQTTYQSFWDDEKRWVLSDKLDVRKIDSVYRTRDMRSARRGEMVLVKQWDEDDDTLERVMGRKVENKLGLLEGVVDVRGPVCPLRKMRLEQQMARLAAA